MFRIAILQILRGWQSSVIIVAAALIVLLLVVIPSAIEDAAINKPQNYLRESGAAVFVLAPGTFDYQSSSILSIQDLQRIQHAYGVSDAQGVINYWTNAQAAGTRKSVVIQSYDPAKRYGGPWKLFGGRYVQNPGETVLDSSLASSLGLELGDLVKLGGASFTVVGLSSGTSSIGKQLAFVSTEDAQRKVLNAPIFNSVEVQTDEAGKVANELKKMGYAAYPTGDFVSLNTKYWSDIIAPTLDLVKYVAILAGFCLLLLLSLMSIRQRRRQIGWYLAAGSSVKRIAGIELIRAGLACLVGLILGVALSIPLISLVNNGTTGLDASPSASLIITSLVAIALAIVIALGLSMLAIRHVDPALIIKEV